MARRLKLRSVIVAIGMLGCAAFAPSPSSAQSAIVIDGDDIGGVVAGPHRPEAGVWVIAGATDLPITFFTKMVVPDDQGRYVVPDLPKASYKVRVRGYGLVDSLKMPGEPGRQLDLQAVRAPSETEARAASRSPCTSSSALIPWPSKDNMPPPEALRGWAAAMLAMGLGHLSCGSAPWTDAAFWHWLF